MGREFDLRKAEVFAGLSPEDFDALAEVGRREVYPPGATVFSGVLRSQSLFVVGEGLVEVVRRDGEGAQTLLARLGPGASFGEVAMLDGSPRNALGVARGTTACFILDAEGLDRLRQKRPVAATRLLANLARGMAERLQRATDQANRAADAGERTFPPHVAGQVRRSLWDRLRGR